MSSFLSEVCAFSNLPKKFISEKKKKKTVSKSKAEKSITQIVSFSLKDNSQTNLYKAPFSIKLTINPSGDTLASISKEKLAIFDLSTRNVTYYEHKNLVTCVAFK